MNMSEITLFLESFQAAYGRVYRYVAGTWWSYNADENQWEHIGARMRIARLWPILARDMFPGNTKIEGQAGRDYMVDRLTKGLIPYLKADTLPGNPFSQ